MDVTIQVKDTTEPPYKAIHISSIQYVNDEFGNVDGWLNEGELEHNRLIVNWASIAWMQIEP